MAQAVLFPPFINFSEMKHPWVPTSLRTFFCLSRFPRRLLLFHEEQLVPITLLFTTVVPDGSYRFRQGQVWSNGISERRTCLFTRLIRTCQIKDPRDDSRKGGERPPDCAMKAHEGLKWLGKGKKYGALISIPLLAISVLTGGGVKIILCHEFSECRNACGLFPRKGGVFLSGLPKKWICWPTQCCAALLVKQKIWHFLIITL